MLSEILVFYLFVGVNITTDTVYGNDVILRESYVKNNAKKSWFDLNTQLLEGALKRFFCFVHHTTDLLETSTLIRLQIWRPAAESQYMLVWEKTIEVDLTSNTGYLCTVSTTFLSPLTTM